MRNGPDRLDDNPALGVAELGLLPQENYDSSEVQQYCLNLKTSATWSLLCSSLSDDDTVEQQHLLREVQAGLIRSVENFDHEQFRDLDNESLEDLLWYATALSMSQDDEEVDAVEDLFVAIASESAHEPLDANKKLVYTLDVADWGESFHEPMTRKSLADLTWLKRYVADMHLETLPVGLASQIAMKEFERADWEGYEHGGDVEARCAVRGGIIFALTIPDRIRRTPQNLAVGGKLFIEDLGNISGDLRVGQDLAIRRLDRTPRGYVYVGGDLFVSGDSVSQFKTLMKEGRLHVGGSVFDLDTNAEVELS